MKTLIEDRANEYWAEMLAELQENGTGDRATLTYSGTDGPIAEPIPSREFSFTYDTSRATARYATQAYKFEDVEDEFDDDFDLLITSAVEGIESEIMDAWLTASTDVADDAQTYSAYPSFIWFQVVEVKDEVWLRGEAKFTVQ